MKPDVRELPDWYLPYYPELRSGSPWVTEDMIALQPQLARTLAAQTEQAAPLASEIRRTWEAGERVTVVGSGTAEYAAFGVAEILDEAGRALGAPPGLIVGRESFEASLDPTPGLCIAVSHGARSIAAVRALEAARVGGARTALITAAPDGTPVARVAELVLSTPLLDKSFCHTLAYLSPLVAAGAATAALGGSELDVTAVGAHLAAARAVEPVARRVAAALHGVDLHITSGSGADLHAARELMLKIEEAVRVPAAMRGLETLLHGHLVGADGGASLIVLVTERRARAQRADRARTALEAARLLGLRTAAIVADDLAPSFTDELASAGVVAVPDEESLPAAFASLTASAFALQWLTMGLVHEAGVNPDLIRREEAAYREVSLMTETKLR